ncbi:MAG: Asparagine synthetase [glutamine-hydrolyzing] 1 [Chroococcopsis gigantea SAG 12.99]|jgi:asparagine synthase (glutamine-hydrolysing)|nr:asparagine synthase (glutamine-hydrolyzing) [Chlorogloea purpurea SAG 13.99]MDV2998521.1 Asparagine synthetase [glutamine-hydrolyzing] 1 [Chroococcopsis gigantea SAG 12.99]
MCGIVGIWQTSPENSIEDLTSSISQMSATLIHRGPDDGGIWIDETLGIALGHRRLSILDLSPQGHQPMISADGRYIIVFNGEIYNFLDLRGQLGRHCKFRGHSDTEVLLEAFSLWGIEATLKQALGMFAFALWDKQEKFLYLGRDRMGEKPLYYGWIDRTFVFASELKAIKAYGRFQPAIDRDALGLFLQYGYIPAPHSIYEGISKLIPGTVLRIENDRASSTSVYWSSREIASHGINNPFVGSQTEAINSLESLLTEVITQQKIADVPLGAFLSGGIDSSLVVALLQKVSNQKVKTFTIGFSEREYDEAQYAAKVARHLGCDHTEMYINSKSAIDVIPLLPRLYDEPFADASAIPTFLVSQLARQGVTVCLSGDGGDELFGGYSQYLWGRKIWGVIGKIPLPPRQLVSCGIYTASSRRWNQLTRLLPLSAFKYFPAGDSLYRLAGVLSQKQPLGIYHYLMCQWQNPESVVIGMKETKTIFNDLSLSIDADLLQQMMYVDTMTGLPDGILVKVDRATMGNSLESRIPFLDPRIFEFAWSLPPEMKVRGDRGKWILRQLLSRYIPGELIDRPKQGFGIPLADWLRSEQLRPWGDYLLSEERLLAGGFFYPRPIVEKWQEHRSGRYNWHRLLWPVLMFQAWLNENPL